MVNREGEDADGVSEDGAGDSEASDQGYDLFNFLPPLQRLEHHALQSIYKRDRNMVGRVLLETLKAVADNPHDVANVFRVLYNMSDSEEPAIRIELMDHVPHIAMLCHSEKEKLLYAADHLLPLVAKQLTDPDAQVRKAAQVTLLVLMDQSLVGQTAVEDVVCPVVDILCESDQNPGSAVQLMCKMAPFLGRESTEKFFLAKFCDLCLHSEIVVRKMCATYFGEFCAVVGQPKTEEFLLSRFVDLCQDDNAEVRKACAEVITSVSCACTLARRKTVLAPMFVTLLWDSLRWVRSSAFKTLGPFISTFAVPSVADLVYNENGELVLVSREGCEFRLNPNTDRAADIEADEDSLGCDSRKDKLLRRSPQSLSRVPLRFYSKNYSRNMEESEDSVEGEEPTENLQVEHEDPRKDEPSLDSSSSNSDLDQEKLIDAEESVKEESHADTLNGAGIVQSVAHALDSSPGSMASTDSSVPVDWDDRETDLKVDPEFITQAGPLNVDGDSSSDQAIGDFTDPVEGKDALIDTPESVTCDSDLGNSFLQKTDIRNSSDPLSEGQCGPLASLFKTLKYKKKLNDMEAESESSSECVTLETDLDDDWRSRKTSDVDLGEDLSESSSEKDVRSLTCTPASTPSEESDFNSFQYWRVPIPEIAIEHRERRRRRVGSQISDKRQAQKYGTSLTSLILSKDSKSLNYQSSSEMPSSPSPPAHRQDILPQELGEQDIVPQELVEHFVSMTNPPHAHMTDVEIALHCAFSLPAVALTLGRENWGFLRRTYEALAADMQWKVRRTVACSIHELAQILGEELTAKDLVPIYTGLIKDLDEVRIGALKHLADFVKLLPSSERKSFLTQFELFLITDNEWNWRFREELAQQLLKIIPLYSPKETCTYLVPVAISLLGDKVAAVRSAALLLVTGLIDHVSCEGPLLRKLLLWLAREFVNSTRWERRQAFALLCSHLVSGCVLGGDQFAREVLPHLLDLSHDRVPNVRLAVARTIASDFMTNQYFSNDQSPHQEVLNEVLKRLISDKDRDVRFFADSRRNCSTQSQQLPTY